MQSLLSQSENNAFQSFLSSIGCTEDAIPADEWATFAASAAASVDPSYSDDDILVESIQKQGGRQDLTKATKDLMSLSTNSNWDKPSNDSMMNHNPTIHPNVDDHETHAIHQQQGHRDQHQHHYHQESHRLNPYPSRHDPFPFLRLKSHHQHQSQPIQFPMQLQHHPLSSSTTASPDSQQRSPISPISQHSPFSFSRQHQAHMPQQQSQQQRGKDRGTPPETRHERSHTLSSPSSPSSLDPPHKRQRLSPSERHSSTPTSTPTTTSTGLSSPGHSSSNQQSGSQLQQQPLSKPNLLSPSQKKANHIQSEQKRRANIRRGYEALCETVPALREAMREQEEAEKASVNGFGDKDGPMANGAGKKRRSKKNTGVDGKDPDDKDKDKIDGRAGPRSENMVLSKTIEHIQHLLAERSSLLTRLQRAKASLPPGHPALISLNPDPPWEREWKGGEGKLILGDRDGDEGSGDEEEDG